MDHQSQDGNKRLDLKAIVDGGLPGNDDLVQGPDVQKKTYRVPLGEPQQIEQGSGAYG